MKKILFCLPSMNLGGTEKALLSMISAIDLDKYQVTIGLIKKTGKLLAEVPAECKVIELPLSPKTQEDLLRGGAVANIKYYAKKGKIFRAFKIAIKKILGNLFAELNEKFETITPLDEQFDIAVAYQMHNPFVTKYVAQKVNANKKAIFIHNDFFTTKYKVNLLTAELANYDKIYAVSQQLKEEFVTILPQYSTQTEIFYNIFNNKKIKELANEFYPEEYHSDVIKICSVGRLNSQKGYYLAIEVAKMLRDDGLKFVWYIVGDGELRSKLQKEIEVNNINDNFILLGSKQNPYPYIKNCDIYCQTSLHEGYCTTTNEAKFLAKPIITTDIAGANEQFVNGFNAFVVDKNSRSIYDKLIELITDKEVQKKFIDNLNIVDWDKPNEKIEEFLNM